MISNRQKSAGRILLVVENIFGRDSGAASARATLEFLVNSGYEVAIIAPSSGHGEIPTVVSKIKALYLTPAHRWYHHIASRVIDSLTKQVFEQFKPQVALFVGSMGKSRLIASGLRKRGVKTGFLFYANEYFCQKIYAARESRPCSLCNYKNNLPALSNGCVSVAGSFNFCAGWMSRWLFGMEINKGTLLIGYGESHLVSYRQAGLTAKNSAVVDFQFNPQETIQARSALKKVMVEDYIAVAGQSIDQKGWLLMAQIFAALPESVRIIASMPSKSFARAAFAKYGLERFEDIGMLSANVDLFCRQDYLDFLANSRAVLIPTCYQTTGEFILQEAMSLGKVVHVFDVGVHSDKLTDNYDACVTTLSDLASYTRKIITFFNDRSESARLEANALRTSQSWYLENSGNSLSKVVGQMLEG